MARVKEEIEMKPPEFWEKRGCELQVFGDAFRLMAQCKGVNTGARVVGARKCGGHKNTIKTMVVWEGCDDYKQVKAKLAAAVAFLNELKKIGYIDTKIGRIKIKIVGGGDMLWINDCLGLGGFAGRFKCSWCEADGDELGGTGQHKTRTLKRGHELAHVAPPGTEYPFTCPACAEVVTEAADPPDTKAAGLKHRNSHFGQNLGCEPIFNIAPMLMVMCALHALLAVAGSVFKNGIGNHLTTQIQCDLIDEYLHSECNTAYKCKRVKLSESQSAMKRPSFDGRSAGLVIGSMRVLVQLKNLGGQPTEEDQHVIDCADAFVELYNCAMERLDDVSNKDERGKRCEQLGVLGLEFHDSYVLAFGASAVTPYVHCLTMHLAQQVAVINGDWTDYSGQALEHKNKERKEHSKITSRRRSNCAKLTKKLEEAKDMFDELAVLEVVGAVIKAEWKHRPNLYQRNLLAKGYMGKKLDTLDRLDDIAEVEKAVKSTATGA